MKRLAFIVVVFVLLGVVSGFAKAYWKIEAHPYDNTKIKAEINAMWDDGYLPVGLSVDGEETVYILYINDSSLPYDNWILRTYDLDMSSEKLSKKITDTLDEGWIPMGMSRNSDTLYLIYLKAESGVDAWRIAPSENTYKSIEETIGKWAKEWYIPCGISGWDKNVNTMLLKIPTTTAKSWVLREYKLTTAKVTEGIDKAVDQGWVPWGLMLRWETAFVLYLKFSDDK